MDADGITWAGNIYEKFEAMCLEVEEVIYEDTVKYVESQVQRVGASVKKFYADVMEDLLPLSCEDIQTDIPKKEVEVLDGNIQPEECSRKSRAGDLNVTSSECFSGHDPREAVTKKTPISDQILSNESLKQEKEDSVATDKDSPAESLRQNDDVETISSHEVKFDIEIIEAFEPVEKSMLEESCILVEGDENKLEGTKNHKSYKKKICDALSLKLRPNRKQNQFVSVSEDEKNDPAHSDFGWELL